MTPLAVGIAGLLELVPISKATIDRRIVAGTFPRPFFIGSRRAWRVADIVAWLEAEAAKPHPSAGSLARRAEAQP